MKPIGRRDQQRLKYFSEKTRIQNIKVDTNNIKKITSLFVPDFSIPKEKIPLPKNLDHTIMVYIDDNNQHFYEAFYKEFKDIKLCIINDSSKDIEDSIRPEIYLGKAGAINYSFSFIDTEYMSIIDIENPIYPTLDFSGCCLMASPISIEKLWSSDIVPRILSVRVELAKQIGFNWDITDPGLIIKEFLFYFSSQFLIDTIDKPPYSLEKNKQEAILIRKDFIEIYPYLFNKKGNSDLIRNRIKIKPLVMR